ncbi:hypothetical protein ABT187_50130 [Streptomyces sp. NPDC001817]|uniref:hypothetical protein n=1 Tax=Streptomyces sp. NPDC001817 TaxID=3154398 RepID=UPI0033198BE8
MNEMYAFIEAEKTTHGVAFLCRLLNVARSSFPAERDQHMRTQLIAHLEELIADTDKLSDFKRGELRGKIADKPGLNRYLRTTPAGKLRIDTARIKTEENLDGKYLLRCSDPKLSAEDIALGYKQLLEVERGWRDMKQIIDLRRRRASTGL